MSDGDVGVMRRWKGRRGTLYRLTVRRRFLSKLSFWQAAHDVLSRSSRGSLRSLYGMLNFFNEKTFTGINLLSPDGNFKIWDFLCLDRNGRFGFRDQRFFIDGHFWIWDFTFLLTRRTFQDLGFLFL